MISRLCAWHRSFLLLWAIYAATSIAIRFLIMYDHNGSDDYGSTLLQGLSSDIITAWALAALTSLFHRFSHVLSGMCVVIWCVLLAANREYISVFASNLSLSDIHQALYVEFVLGSVMHSNFLPSLGILLLLAGTVLFLARRPYKFVKKRKLLTAAAYVILAAASLEIFLRPSPLELGWKSIGLIDQNLHFYMADRKNPRGMNEKPTIQSLKFSQEVFGKDLDAPLFVQQRPGSNVLLITVEALGQAALDDGTMPKLSAIAARGLHFKSAVIPSFQTIVGIAAMNCAMPYFKSLQPAALISEVKASRNHCLPYVLSRQGYYTEYIQPTVMRFMKAWQLNAAMGYEKSFGGNDLATLPFPGLTGWGVDDKALYKAAAERIALANQSGRPWLYQIMTVSTHHPYTVPEAFLPDTVLPRQERAFRFADEAVSEFVTWLEENGYLENTLVIITGDETHRAQSRKSITADKVENIERLNNALDYHHGTFIILGPGIAPRTITTPVIQTDMAVSVLDYLGLAALSDIPGHSLLRDYPRFRPIMFGLHAQRNYGAVMRPGILSFCFGGDNCGNYGFSEESPFDTSWWKRKYDLSDDENNTIRPLF